MKKKIFALLLAVLMLVPFIVACGGGRDTDTDTNTSSNKPPVSSDTETETQAPQQSDTQTETQAPQGSDTETEAPSESDTETDAPSTSDTETEAPSTSDTETDTSTGSTSTEKVSTKENPSKKWDGKTLDVLADLWYGTPSAAEAGTWSQPEFYVTGYLNTTQYGQTINDAVWARQEFIQTTYGVTLKWHAAKNQGVMQSELQSGLEAGYDKFHVALPRMYTAQTLISADTVYDLANSKYIDLSASYYNQAAVESFSVYGHTFFVAGDFSFVDETTTAVVFYNQAISESIKTFPNLYNKVENGTWTISELAKWAQLIGKDDNGEVGYQDTDTYGFGSTALSSFFQSSGIQQVSTRTVAGTNYKEYYISLNDNSQAVSSLYAELTNIKSSNWARTSWDGGYDALGESFTKGKLLFYHEVVQKFDGFPAQNDNFKVGVLPMPMLNEDQETYYSPLASQTTVMCIPKCTTDREMSEYFFDVLSWTGQEYVMDAYYDTLELKLYDDGDTSREDALRMLTDYVFPGMCYDQGYMYEAMGSKFMTDSVQTATVNSTSTASPFMTLYAEAMPTANKILNDSKTGWNTYAKNYKD
ncbi:MAG: hypothetical protein IJ437_06225 [Clostridia bacterium]|nr:hypothetical protein [Clostridia bacterium]